MSRNVKDDRFIRAYEGSVFFIYLYLKFLAIKQFMSSIFLRAPNIGALFFVNTNIEQ